MQVFRKSPEFSKFYQNCLDRRKFVLYKKLKEKEVLFWMTLSGNLDFCDLHPWLKEGLKKNYMNDQNDLYLFDLHIMCICEERDIACVTI